MAEGKIRFEIVGVYTCEEYQKCKFYAQYLWKFVPELFVAPALRPMLDVQWTEYLTQCRRNYGRPFWMLQVPVAVFKNGKFFGNDSEFVEYCKVNFQFYVCKNFAKYGLKQLKTTIRKSERSYVYFTLSIDGSTVGTLFFQLYTDLVPITCDNFLRLCRKRSHGYRKSSVYRIAKSSWIQVGGSNLQEHGMSCENYIVPHDQRGVLSMCNNGKHKDNSTQFFVTLNPTPWMDYYYVAFGQLIHGEDVLRKIETVPTEYESPTVSIVIDNCGELTCDNFKLLEAFQSSKNHAIPETEYEYEEDIHCTEVVM